MALAAAIKSALKVFADDREKWQAIQRAGMAQDFSWENSARKYLELYQTIIKKS
jgi:starch synthase